MAIHSFLFSFRKKRTEKARKSSKLKSSMKEKKVSYIICFPLPSCIYYFLCKLFHLFQISILNQMSNLLTEHFLLILQFRNIKHSQWPEEIKILSILQIRVSPLRFKLGHNFTKHSK